MTLLLLLAACGGSAPAPVAPAPVAPAPAPQVGCDPGLVAVAADPARIADVRAAAEACLGAARLDDARALADALFPAADADPVAHLVAARVLLAQQAADGNPCDHEAYTRTILEHTARVTDAAALAADPAFAPVHGAWRYHLAAQPDAGLVDRLAGTTWWGPAAGVYGNQSRLRLDAGGTGVLSLLDVPDDGPPTWADAPTTWRVEGDHVLVGDDPTPLSLLPDGRLGDPDDFGPWSDTPSECEA